MGRESAAATLVSAERVLRGATGRIKRIGGENVLYDAGTGRIKRIGDKRFFYR